MLADKDLGCSSAFNNIGHIIDGDIKKESYTIQGFHNEYCWTVMMAFKSKPSSLFGERLLQMNWDNSTRQSLMSSIEYPVIVCTV